MGKETGWEVNLMKKPIKEEKSQGIPYTGPAKANAFFARHSLQ